jgi:hypothetical protein
MGLWFGAPHFRTCANARRSSTATPDVSGKARRIIVGFPVGREESSRWFRTTMRAFATSLRFSLNLVGGRRMKSPVRILKAFWRGSTTESAEAIAEWSGR